MKILETTLKDVYLLEPRIFADDRGYFFESFNSGAFNSLLDREVRFVQDNESHSKQGVLRGLHYQLTKPQAKLVRVVSGSVFDVAVDLRVESPTFGKWFGAILSDENKKQLWIPEGFAHGFLVLSEHAKFQYKVTDYWYPEAERCIAFDDPGIGIKWPLDCINMANPQVSEKDRAGKLFKDAEIFTK